MCRKHRQCLCSCSGETRWKAQQTEAAQCLHVCEKRRERRRDQSGGLWGWADAWAAFSISVWEVKPHLPRMLCFTPRSPLRFRGASLLFALSLFISRLQRFSASLDMVAECDWTQASHMHTCALTHAHTHNNMIIILGCEIVNFFIF